MTSGTLHSAVFTKPESVRQVTAACSTMGMCPHGVALANLLRGRPMEAGRALVARLLRVSRGVRGRDQQSLSRGHEYLRAAWGQGW